MKDCIQCLNLFDCPMNINESICKSLLSGIIFTPDYSKKEILSIISNVLTNDNISPNIVYTNNLIIPFTFNVESIKQLIQIFYDGFYNSSERLHDDIQNNILQNTFTTQYVLDIYNKFVKNGVF